METGKFEIMSAGLHTTIQDMGRFGCARWGFPPSGGMDIRLVQIANRLVGNRHNAPVLEFARKGDTIRFLSAAIIAIASPDVEVFCNDVPISLFKALEVKQGDVLRISHLKTGNFGYLSIFGEIEAESFYESFSTHTISQTGGYFGRKLQTGDQLRWKKTSDETATGIISRNFHPKFESLEQTFRCLPSPEMPKILENVKKFRAKVASDGNRMGFRISLNSIAKPAFDIQSSATCPGTIQYTGNGEAVVLMRDAQVSGGYPRIAQVISADISRFSQLRPGSEIQFESVDSETAIRLHRHQEMYLKNTVKSSNQK